MLRSMYSGVSGLKNFQTKLDVIGNNIANVNTYGFKKGRVTFKDTMNQTIGGATAPSTALGMGGINAKQVGLGSQVATIDTLHDAGSIQTTNRVLDLAIQGDGYFQVQKGIETLYTRAGNFYFDNNGSLVTGSGEFVTDSDNAVVEIENIDEVENISIGVDGKISYIRNGVLENYPGGAIAVVRFANSGGLEKAGGNLFKVSQSSGGPSEVKEPGQSGAGTILSGALEMSNVDLSEEFTEMITTQRAFQANTKIITTSDEILQELVNLKR
ncbi:flagellar basal body rod protein FlgG [Bacillus sp. V3B]|uniref:flagellar basal body rod protein FlgG n=1 Tax=Bacillus sp. V3B TaxID=2804915 RepID=UPI0021091D19|nr:flagellar basal body rod protein FlgG [Bacillus sp. V3B]MCQ6274100.1 flagellar basal body rod protein FlgG [Bacillus sp. V3B]